jgi:hypothetical protein
MLFFLFLGRGKSRTILRSHALLSGPPRWGIENISAPALVPLGDGLDNFD